MIVVNTDAVPGYEIVDIKGMMQQAENAILNVRFSTSAITSGASEMLAYGTAAVVRPVGLAVVGLYARTCLGRHHHGHRPGKDVAADGNNSFSLRVLIRDALACCSNGFARTLQSRGVRFRMGWEMQCIWLFFISLVS